MRPQQCCLGLGIVGLIACGGRSTPLTPTTPAAPAPPTSATCSFALDAGIATFDASGGGASATLTTGAGCRWTLDVSGNEWVRPSSAGPFVGSSTFTITVEPNRSFSSRSATLAVKDQGGESVATGLWTQRSAGCLYTVSPTSEAFDGIGTYYPGEPPSWVDVRVHAQPADCRWTVKSMPSWVQLTWFSPKDGTGDATISVIVTPNTGASQRTGDVVVAGLSGVNPDAQFTLVQVPR
jgi:hypothetical protein